MVAVVRRLRHTSRHLLLVFFALAACFLALIALLHLLEYRRSVLDSHRGSLLPALDTPVVTPQTVLVLSRNRISVSSPKVSLGTVATSTGNKSINATGLHDVFISVKTTGIYHITRIKLLQRTWLTLAQNQVLEIRLS